MKPSERNENIKYWIKILEKEDWIKKNYTLASKKKFSEKIPLGIKFSE